MNKLLPLIAVGGVLLLLTKSSKAETEVTAAIREAAVRYNVPPSYLYGICKTESSCSQNWAYRFHPDGVSYGLFGLTRYVAPVPLPDIQKQANYAAAYLRKCYDTFKGWNLAIQAYHLGIPAVKRGKRDYSYLKRVLSFSKDW